MCFAPVMFSTIFAATGIFAGDAERPPGAVHVWGPAAAGTETSATSASLRNLAVSRDGTEILIAGPGSVVSVWNAQTGRPERRLSTGTPAVPITTLAACGDGSFIARAGKHLVRWSADGERRTVRLQNLPDNVQVAAFSPDGRLFAAFGDRPPIAIWDTETAEKRLELDESVWADLLAFSPDGRRLAVSRMMRLWVFDVAASEPLWKQRPEGTIRHLRFAPDGSRLTALVDYDGLLDFDIDPATGQLRPADPFALRRTIRHSRGGGADRKLVAVSPDSTLVAESDGGTALRIWELTTARDVLVLDTSEGAKPVSRGGARGLLGTRLNEPSAVVFLGDSRRLVTATADGGGIVWDLASRDFAAEPPGDRPLTTDAAATLWRQLGDDSGETAWRALVALVHRPEEALRLIERPPSIEGPANHLISQLDHEDAALRTLATRRLADMSVAVEGLLRRSANDGPSPEAAARLRRLLRRLAGPDKQQELDRLARTRRFRGLRTVRLLTWIGTAEARESLVRRRREWHDPFVENNPEAAAEADRALERWPVADAAPQTGR